MANTIDNVKNILRINDTLFYDFGEYSKIYSMTTENIGGFLQCHSLQDSNVLTVAGSGDQMLNSYLLGAKNVTCFDINPLAFYQVSLKKAAVSSLSYQEFLEFFFPEFGNLFNIKSFNKLANNLDYDTYDFFNYLYSKYNSSQILEKIYYDFIPNLAHMKKMNLYFDEVSYNKLGNILKDKTISFINSDVTLLNNYLSNNTYDMIMLSNISDSIQNIWPNDPLNNFKNLIYSLSEHLNLYGTIQVGYIYNYYSTKQNGIFSWKKERQAVFDTREFHTNFVCSYDDTNRKDAIITYQKTK